MNVLLGTYLALPPPTSFFLWWTYLPFSGVKCSSRQRACRWGIRGEKDVPVKLSPRLLFTVWGLSFRIFQWFSNFRDIGTWWKAWGNTGSECRAWCLWLSRFEVRPSVCLLDEFPGGTDSAGLGPRCRTALAYAHGRKTSTRLITGCSAHSVTGTVPVAWPTLVCLEVHLTLSCWCTLIYLKSEALK